MIKLNDRKKLFNDEIKPLFDAGYELIPLKNPGAKDKKGKDASRTPRDKGWQFHPYTKDEILSHFLDGGNVGVRPQENDVIVDVDPRNFKTDQDFENFCAEFDVKPELFPCALSGGGGIHIYMKKPKTKGKQ